MSDKTLTQADLKNFTGTCEWHRHQLNRNVLYTDGAMHVAESGEAYWLLDEIVLAQLVAKVQKLEFQVWKLIVRANSSAKLVCEDGNDNVIYVKEIEFTDFPLEEITFYFANSVILLPSEY